jgi:hypothetical protein
MLVLHSASRERETSTCKAKSIISIVNQHFNLALPGIVGVPEAGLQVPFADLSSFEKFYAGR